MGSENKNGKKVPLISKIAYGLVMSDVISAGCSSVIF